MEVYGLLIKPRPHKQIQANAFGTMEKIEMYEKGVGVSNWGRWRKVEFLETDQLQQDFICFHR